MTFVKDPSKNILITFSFSRSKRPHSPSVCPFCSGNESLTPPSTLRLPKDSWRVRCFRNAFPVIPGAHEVIVETNRHGETFENFSRGQLGFVFKAYQNRFRAFLKKSGYVFLFKNFGPQSGASIPHEHSQVVRFPFVPEMIRTELLRENVFAKLLRGPVLFENTFFKAVCPPFSRFPWEVWIMAKDPKKRFENFSKYEGLALLELAQTVLRKIKRYTPDYTIAFHTAPPGKNLRFHVEIYPRKPVWGGIELGAGVIVNFKKPKSALAELKRA